MSNDEVSRGIIRALIKLANSGKYEVDLDGAAAVTQLVTAATNHLLTLTASIEEVSETDEVIDDE